MLFDEEERGLRGSRAFAQMLADQKHPVFAVHTIDQMGWDSNHNRAIELELPYDGVLDVYQAAARTLKMPITRSCNRSGTVRELLAASRPMT